MDREYDAMQVQVLFTHETFVVETVPDVLIRIASIHVSLSRSLNMLQKGHIRGLQHLPMANVAVGHALNVSSVP